MFLKSILFRHFLFTKAYASGCLSTIHSPLTLASKATMLRGCSSLPHTLQGMVGGPALSSGVNPESHIESPLSPASSCPCQGSELTLKAGLTQRLRKGLNTDDTGSGNVLEGPWGSFPCSQEGNTGGKKETFLSLVLLHMNMELEALRLSCQALKSKESQRTQRLKLSHLEHPLPLYLLVT